MNETLCCWVCGESAKQRMCGPLCDRCYWLQGRIFYGGKHDDFTIDTTMNRGHMAYMRHPCEAFLIIDENCWCECGRQWSEKPRHPLALVEEQIAEILQRTGGVI